MDIVQTVIAVARQPAAGSGHAARLQAAAAARQLAASPVGAIHPRDNDVQIVYPTQLEDTLLQVVHEGFASPVDKLACHRLAVFQPTGHADPGGGYGSADLGGMADGRGLQITHIVSQSDILRFLHRHQHQLGQQLFDASLAQLGFREKQVMCVPADLSIIESLAGMADAKVAAVAVVDSFESGRLLGSLSISDLRGILPEHFEQLAEPVGDFLSGGGGSGGSWRHGSPWWQRGQQQLQQQPGTPTGVAAEFGVKSPEQLPHPPSLAACTLGTRFGDVLAILTQQGIHRVFLVDSEGRPAGVVSLSDILRLIAGAEG